MRTVVMVAGHDGTRFEIDFGRAYSVLNKKNFAAAARESLFAAFFRPMGWRLPQFFILHQLNRHVAKGFFRKISCDVSKVPRRKPRVAVHELHIHWWLALDFVGEVS